MIDVMIYGVSEAVQVYEIYLLMKCFLTERKVSKNVEMLCYSILYFVMSLPYLCFNIPIFTLACSFLGGMMIPFIYKGKIREKIAAGIFVFILFFAAECIVAPLTGYIDVDMFAPSDYHSTFATVCLPVIGYLLVRIVRNFMNIRTGEKITTPYWIISCSLPLLVLVAEVILYRQRFFAPGAIFAITIILFAILLMSFFLYDHQIESYRMRHEKKQIEQENVYQVQQIKLMEEWLESDRKLRHDFKKHVSMIEHLIQCGERKELERYLVEIEQNIQKNSSDPLSGNRVIDSILNIKLAEMASVGIRPEVNLLVPSDLELSMYDMNLLLSNLLNAISI